MSNIRQVNEFLKVLSIAPGGLDKSAEGGLSEAQWREMQQAMDDYTHEQDERLQRLRDLAQDYLPPQETVDRSVDRVKDKMQESLVEDNKRHRQAWVSMDRGHPVDLQPSRSKPTPPRAADYSRTNLPMILGGTALGSVAGYNIGNLLDRRRARSDDDDDAEAGRYDGRIDGTLMGGGLGGLLGYFGQKSSSGTRNIHPVNEFLKHAESIAFQPRQTRPIRPFLERLVLGPAHEGATEVEAEKMRRMLQLMAMARPEALEHTKLFVGRPKPEDIINQLFDTREPHDSFISDLSGIRDETAFALGAMPEAGLEQFPSAYLPVGDAAILPEKSLGVALHEAGHALDFNRPRRGGKFRRDLSWRLKPSVLAEPLAWGRGARAMSEGAALSDDPSDRELAKEVLMDAYTRRGPALGTYFGGASGAALGGAAGAALGWGLGIPLTLGGVGAFTGGTLGTFGGALLGKQLAKNPEKARTWADKMLDKSDKSRDDDAEEKTKESAVRKRAFMTAYDNRMAALVESAP